MTNFLAIGERELREHSRRKSAYRWRFGFAAVGMVSFLWVSLGHLIRSSPNAGRNVFELLIWITFIFAAAAGVIFSSDSISREKREGTLGLLFLTNLRGYDVVLGKLVSSSLTACYGFMAVIPILSASIVFGGIMLGEFWRFIFVLANTLFLSCATGIFVSACFRDQRLAQGTTLLVLFAITGCDQIVSALGGGKVLLPTPASALSLAAATNYSQHAIRFWTAAGCTQIAAWILLAMASWILPRVWQDRVPKERTRARISLRERVSRYEANAFRWLAERDLEFRPVLWRVLFWTGIFALLAVLLALRHDSTRAACLAGWFALHSVLKLWVAAQAGHRFGEDRRNGCLELLLATQLRAPDILQSQKQALRRALVRPLILIGIFDVVLMSLAHTPALLFLLGVGWAALFLDLYTLSWVGMWTGLSVWQPGRAVGNAVWRVLVRPWVIFIALVVMTAVPRVNMVELVLIWLAISMINNLFAWVGAIRGLDESFEALAMQPQYLLR